MREKKKTLGRTEKKILIVSGIALLLTLIIGISYAYIMYTTRQITTNEVGTDCINVEMQELTNAINLTDAFPVLDEVGKRNKPFRFKLTNTCGVGVNYDINLEKQDVKEGENEIAAKNIAVLLDDNKEKIVLTTPIKDKTPETYLLEKGELKPGASIEHEIRLWLDEDADNDAQNGKFYSKVVIEAYQNQITEYQETILNGAYPVLADNLIPVEIDDTGKVTKANLSSEWYSYEKKRWANAVILEDETVEYQDNEEIPESNIESYFVWIPKYSYQLWGDLGNYTALGTINSGLVHPINIKFGIENTSDSNSGECTTPMTSGVIDNCVAGDYMTPPAFITMGTNGLWVGKFETGYKGATTTETAQSNTSDSMKVQVKPNVYSWRNIQLANAHLASYNYQRELDSHMMKNTEWGAVAYLQHSKYGSATSVRINNNSAYITGYAAKNEPTTGVGNYITYESTSLGADGTNTYNYKNTNSQVASATGNYTGIYDMSGGAWEYMMSVMLDSTNRAPLSGRNATYHSNFNGAYSEGGTFTGGINFPSDKVKNTDIYKYFDTYAYSTSYSNFNRRILGDGTGEFGPHANVTYNSSAGARQVGSWYADEGWFVHSTHPWFERGGHYSSGLGAGVFHFNRGAGNADTGGGFRVVLAV